MEKITASHPDANTLDLVSENLEHLKDVFPEAFTEGKVDFEVLKQLLGGLVDEREEKYGLNWHGKRRSRQLALMPSTGTLRPCPEESANWETTQNLMIEGDNLEVLKLLQKSYAGKIKLIYIDPPYNTGKDFVYPDNFKNNIRNYLELTGQVDSNGHRGTTNTEASGRFHTDWLNMIYPRLRLAQTLLSAYGAIFVSIGDHEVHNLRTIMDEIFGPENFITTVIWQKVFAVKNSTDHFSGSHDFILVYARNVDLWDRNLLPRTTEQLSDYKNPDNDPRGLWNSVALSARNPYSEGLWSCTTPSGRFIEGPPKGRYWSVSYTKFQLLDQDNRIWWGKNKDGVPRRKVFLSEVQQGIVPETLWLHEDVGNTQEAKKELLKRLEFESSLTVFETPKPTRLIEKMLNLGTAKDSSDLVLDFFAGSGTTGESVMQLNAKDQGNRRFILVQLPEQTGAKDFKTISDMTKARLRSAAKAQIGDTGQQSLLDANHQCDVGFRVFKLDSTNILPWDPDRDNMPQSLLNSITHLKTDRTELDILFELLLKLGLNLTVPIEQKKLADKTVHAIGAGSLFVCLATKLGREDVEPIAMGIVEWHRQLAPAGECQVVFRDSAFADDVAKTNLTAILQQHGLENVRSL